jgi:archaellum biogenesis ATPase FlaH
MAELKLKKMSEFQTEPIEWLWEPYIPLGAITILQGDGGLGKTTISSAIAAAVSTGTALPGQSSLSRAPVIMQNAEDSYSKTMRPRLEDFNADCDKIHVIDENEQPLSFTDERIEQAIMRTKPKLVIIDPIQAYFGGRDMNSTGAVRPIMKQLGKVAERNNCAVLLVGHFHKQGSSPQYRGLGSIDIYATARSVLTVGKTDMDDDIRAVVHNKSNLSSPGVSQAFGFDPADGFKWLGDYEITVEEMLSGKRKEKVNDGQTDSPPEGQSGKARRLIESALAGGAIPAADMMRMAVEQDISAKTLNRAKDALGVLSVKRGSQWYWELPIDVEYTEVSQDSQHGHSEHGDVGQPSPVTTLTIFHGKEAV